MDLKETLDKLTEVIRFIQHANQSPDQIVTQLQKLTVMVGQLIVQKEEVEEILKKYHNQLWISHIKGHIDCPACQFTIPFDFFVGSKGITGKPMSASTQDQLIEKLEFPPINVEDLKSRPIPDYMPEI